MKTIKYLAATALAVVAVASCGSPSKQMGAIQNLKVVSNPTVLELIDGNVDAQVSITFPAKYFNANAILEIVPVLVYEGGEAASQTVCFQGSKVKNNYTVVPAKEESTQKVDASFAFVKGMEISYLELRSTVVAAEKRVALPAIKVADGVITTNTLAKPCVALKADSYKETIVGETTAKIGFDLNSAVIRNTAANKAAMKDFTAAIKGLDACERTTIGATRIDAYTSPEGGSVRNQKLSERRSAAVNAKWKTLKGGVDIQNPEINSLGQDWLGFQEAVSASNLADKDLILRVLSEYSDPDVRENEIRNMGFIFPALAKDIFPALRRANIIVLSEFKNYTIDELKAMKAEGKTLTEDQLLHLAANAECEQKVAFLKEAFENYKSAEAAYNLAAIAVMCGNAADAGKYIAAAADDADTKNVKGAIAFMEGDKAAAEKLFAEAGTDAAKQNAAMVQITKGQYAQAAAALKGTKTYNEALANVLVGNYDAAKEILTCDCPDAAYLKAVIAARQGKASDVKKNLEKAAKCDCLKARAAKDIEFVPFK